jgi:hypothetical protein
MRGPLDSGPTWGTLEMDYRERFPAGTRVRIASREDLERFRHEWSLHNPLTAEQLSFGAHEVVVAAVGFYHGGEPLYVSYIGVTGVATLHDELRLRGALITKSLEARAWSCIDFYVEDPDGYILCFSEPTA